MTMNGCTVDRLQCNFLSHLNIDSYLDLVADLARSCLGKESAHWLLTVYLSLLFHLLPVATTIHPGAYLTHDLLGFVIRNAVLHQLLFIFTAKTKILGTAFIGRLKQRCNRVNENDRKIKRKIGSRWKPLLN